MKVKELIAILQELDQEEEILIPREEDSTEMSDPYVDRGHPFWLPEHHPYKGFVLVPRGFVQYY